VGALAIGLDFATFGEATEATGLIRTGTRLYERGLGTFSRNGQYISRNVFRDLANAVGQRNKGLSALGGIASGIGSDFQLTAPLASSPLEWIPFVGGAMQVFSGAGACYHALAGR
jgi:hypothetical protein